MVVVPRRYTNPPAQPLAKTCIDCGQSKLLSEFNKRSEARDGRRAECRACQSDRNWHKYHDNPEYRTKQIQRGMARDRTPKGREQAQWRRLKYKFGLTKEQYLLKVAEQEGKCAICLEEVTDRLFSVDHDHLCCPGIGSCGECIRGLLCAKCNSALGMLREDTEIMQRMIFYTEVWRDLRDPIDMTTLEVR